MQLAVLTWNLFHGRDAPPNPHLYTWRSRLLRITERDATHLQVNRDLLSEFAAVICGADWDVALLQEAPPRWAGPLAARCGAEAHRALTSRNSLGVIRELLARLDPDLIASNEGGSNLTLVRGGWSIAARRELVLAAGPRPERRVMAFTELRHADGAELGVANLHLSAGPGRRAEAERELVLAAERAAGWVGERPLLFGGDLNIRPADSDVYDRIAAEYGMRGTTGPDSLDHLLARGLTPAAPQAIWPAERREVPAAGLAIRLSDHAPVSAAFEL